MFSFLNKKSPTKSESQNLTTEIITLKGLDCPSCAIDLDLTLEDLTGVTSAKTNYAKSEIKITFNTNKTSVQKINTAIKKLGYI